MPMNMQVSHELNETLTLCAYILGTHKCQLWLNIEAYGTENKKAQQIISEHRRFR